MVSKVSVIVPIYNVEDYVEKCIVSLLAQSMKEIEIWAISDGSQDHSIDIVEKIAKCDERIKCIRKENGGYGSVLEYAINNIFTDYFIICDPDDWLESDAIETLYKAAVNNSVDLVVGCKYITYKEKNEKMIDYICPSNHPVIENKKYTDLEPFVYMGVSPHAKLYKTSKAKMITFPHKVSHTDNTLFYLYLSSIDSALYLKRPLAYHFVDRPGNTREQLEVLTQKSFEQNMFVYDDILCQLDNQSELFYAICEQLFEIMITFIGRLYNTDLNVDNYNVVYSFIDSLKPYKSEIRKHMVNDCRSKTLVRRVAFDMVYNKRLRNIGMAILIKKPFFVWKR